MKIEKILVKTLSPLEFAKKLVAKQGYDNAFRIIATYAHPSFGNAEGSTPNPSFGYYSNALGYLKNRAPKRK